MPFVPLEYLPAFLTTLSVEVLVRLYTSTLRQLTIASGRYSMSPSSWCSGGRLDSKLILQAVYVRNQTDAASDPSDLTT